MADLGNAPIDEVENCLLETGKLLIENGAETFRVEETIEIIGRSLGYQTQCYVTLTAIFIKLDNQNYNFLKTGISGNNLQVVDDVNGLSRKLTSKKIDFEQFQSAINEIASGHYKTFKPFYMILGAGMVSVAPLLLFHTNWLSLFICFFVGIIGFTASNFVLKVGQVPYVNFSVAGALISTIANLLAFFFPLVSASAVIIGSIMPLVPGLAITNGIRELIRSHFLSGTVRLSDSILVAISIGLGIAVGALVKLIL